MKHWRRRFVRYLVVGMCVGTVYVLSYAPAVHYSCDRVTTSFADSLWTGMGEIDCHPIWFYLPVDWLLDHTVLQKPILAWSELWLADRIQFTFDAREYYRNGLPTP